jgi:hypothetical protein
MLVNPIRMVPSFLGRWVSSPSLVVLRRPHPGDRAWRLHQGSSLEQYDHDQER